MRPSRRQRRRCDIRANPFVGLAKRNHLARQCYYIDKDPRHDEVSNINNMCRIEEVGGQSIGSKLNSGVMKFCGVVDCDRKRLGLVQKKMKCSTNGDTWIEDWKHRCYC